MNVILSGDVIFWKKQYNRYYDGIGEFAMKRLFALMTAIMLLACSCSKKSDTDRTAISPENLAVSLALTCHTAAWPESSPIVDDTSVKG